MSSKTHEEWGAPTRSNSTDGGAIVPLLAGSLGLQLPATILMLVAVHNSDDRFVISLAVLKQLKYMEILLLCLNRDVNAGRTLCCLWTRRISN